MPSSRRPYLIRAIYDWANDNGLTPYLVVAADYPDVDVPADYVSDGRITLNISPQAVQRLDLSGTSIQFSARFSGQPYSVHVPAGGVLAVYAQETGEGVMFGEVETDTPPPGGDSPPPDEPSPDEAPRKRGHLRVVK